MSLNICCDIISCNTAIPLFWMVFGSLLPKEESIRYVYRHRVLRMVLILALFPLFQYIFQPGSTLTVSILPIFS